ncbi:cytochrome B561 [Carbonactinospora thermoautotrophica]|uniref:Cytochrome B561 n=2 Tax=Carbonactinospora thermoautotrophica TaxID=1469144 RepID=A0A132N2K9_9ACTN|nr:cytochrome B561 [Carbonactinospora thermoautotrophica]
MGSMSSPSLMARIRTWAPSDRTVRLACLAVLVMNVVIVVTGGAVRLTGSGLGCPTWPTCTGSSLVATPEMGIHGAIEFGNRTLTGVLSVVVGWAIITTMRQRPRRAALVRLAWAQLAGVAAQALLGGVTVLTGLAPLTVAGHFLLSMALIAGATALWVRSGETDEPARPLVRRELRALGTLLVVVVGVAVALGTVVTGSGPHSGDPDVTHRFPISPAAAAQLHADAAFLTVGLSVALWFALRATDAPASVRVRTRDLILVELAQGLIGYVQYFTHLPILLVGIHMLGSCLVWVAALRLYLGMRERPRSAQALKPVAAERQQAANAA